MTKENILTIWFRYTITVTLFSIFILLWWVFIPLILIIELIMNIIGYTRNDEPIWDVYWELVKDLWEIRYE